jgi:hypothetical protein
MQAKVVNFPQNGVMGNLVFQHLKFELADNQCQLNRSCCGALKRRIFSSSALSVPAKLDPQ